MGAACSDMEKGSGMCVKTEDAKKEEEEKSPKKKKGKGKKDEEETEKEEPNKEVSSPTLQRSGSTLKRSGSSVGMQEQKKKTDMIRYEKNVKRMKKIALEVSGELNHFSVFLKKHFPNPGEAFVGLSGSSTALSVEMEKFVDGLQKLEFGGDETKIFFGLCDDHAWGAHPIITKDAFVKRLGSMGNPFIQVVRQACLRDRSKIKKKVAEAMMAKNRDPEIVEEFRKFIEPKFPTPGKCFDAIAGDDGNIDEDEFVDWLTNLDFKGDASKAFHNFCDADGYITRMAFTNILVVSNTDAPSGENPQEADAPKKGKSKSSIKGQEEDPDSPATATPKRKGKKKTTESAVKDLADGGGEESPDSPAKRPARRKSTVQTNDATTEDKDTPAKAKPKARKSVSKADVSEGQEPVSPKTPLKRSTTGGGEDEAPAKGKAKAKAKRRNSTS